MKFVARILQSGVLSLVFLCAFAARGAAVTLDIALKLTDMDYKPLAGVPVRVVFGPEPDWQGANAGRRLLTNNDGEARWTAQVVLEDRMKKYPSNFVSNLTSGRQPTQYLRVGAEMTYFEFPWLYTVDLYRFSTGDTMLDESSVYTRDDRGAFTRKAREDKNGWTMADLGGLVLTVPGFEAWNFALDPIGDPTGKRWSLKIAFKKAPAPTRR